MPFLSQFISLQFTPFGLYALLNLSPIIQSYTKS